jgi:signal transduction histidine kinase
VVTFSALGLGGVSAWMSWQMQQILVTTNKQTITYIADRFPHDVEIYSQMLPVETGIQKAIENLTDNKTLLWMKNNDQKIIANSPNFDKRLLSIKNIPPLPEISKVNNNYWLLCASPLKVKNTQLGTLYIAQNITGEQLMFINLFRSLSIATIIAIIIIGIAVAFYVKYSLKPLQKISQISSKISASKLSEAHINLENPPTEVKKLARTLEDMLFRLSANWENQKQLLNNVSHELRTPLTIVSGYIQSILRRGENLTEIQKEALTTANNEANRTIQLLQDLLDLARADNGTIYIQLETINLNDLVLEIVEMAREYTKRKIELECLDRDIILEADSNRMKQVLLNLIDNAVKYSDETKPVIVKIKQNQKIIIEVLDYGIGIPLAQQSRIFERFYRIDEARSRTIGGTGLGLSIVKTLVEAMGGNILVRSELGKGSTFTIIF